MQTQNYFQSRREALSLKKEDFASTKRPRRYALYSLPFLLYQLAKNSVQWLRFAGNVITRARYFRALKELRGKGIGRSALVLGLGPSLEALSFADLRRFQSEGGFLVVCNSFNGIEGLDSVVPDLWVLSDPLEGDQPGFPNLVERIRQKSIQVIVPESQYIFWRRHLGGSPISTFCDIEIRPLVWRSRGVRPDRPRNYSSVTLFKALAIATWIDFDTIFVLGMDNSYPHDIFVDEKNKLWQILVHSYGEPKIISRSSEYSGIADYLFEHAQLFRDLEFFPRAKVVNLDSFSLTDAFPKRQPAAAGNNKIEPFWLTK